MGLMDKAIAKSFDNVKNAIFQEAAGHGSQVIGFEQFTQGGQSMGSLLAGGLKDKMMEKIPFAGSKEVIDGYQIYGLQTAGVRHLYVQPFAQALPLPGEHHAWLSGALRSPIAFRHGMMLWGFDAGGDEELVQWLETQGALMATVKLLKKAWKASNKVWDLEWTMQLASMGHARSHLVMQAGSFGGMLGPMRVGINELVSLGAVITPMLTQNAYPVHHALYPPQFTHFFQHYILNAPSQPPPAQQGAQPGAQPHEAAYAAQPSQPPQPAQPQGPDFSAAIFEAAAPFASQTFFIGHLPGEVEANVRALILPAHQKQAPICIVLDLTAFGSAKDAVVITRDYVYVRDMGETMGFSLTEIGAVEAPKGVLAKTVKVQLKSGRTLKVPCQGDGKGLHAVLARCAS